MTSPTEELSVKISESLKEPGRWRFVEDSSWHTGPWFMRLDDSRTPFSIGCIIDPSSNPGHFYLCVSDHGPDACEPGYDLGFSIDEKKKIWDEAMPLFSRLKAEAVELKQSTALHQFKHEH